MAETILAEIIKSIGEKLGSYVYNRIMSAQDLDSQIKELQEIKTTIEATLLDADSSHFCSHSQRAVLEKLEDGLAKLDDFLDAKAAKAKQKELMAGHWLTKETGLFFSGSNQLVSPIRDARKLKSISGELSLVARNHAQFGTLIVSTSSLNQTRALGVESGSYPSTDLVVGRDGDRENIISMLLDTDGGPEPVSVVSILGIGGQGKTTLAQYVCNDTRIKSYFEAQFWVFATHDFTVRDVLEKIIASATDNKPRHCEMDQLQHRLTRVIAGRKFLLVLDNIWEQDGSKAKWDELRALLRVGARGSKVLITTRSEIVARIMSTHEPYKLQDLSQEDSWLLFMRIAFTQWHEPGVVAIGVEIARMCRNVPLVIRSIGGLLAEKHTVQQWQAFRDNQFANFTSYGREILDTLKLSYDQLDARLKLCFAICSLFPKGFTFFEDVIIHYWVALGYIKPLYEAQSVEDAAKEDFFCLVNRGFFQYAGKKIWGYKDQFMMHDLMHDLALSVAGVKYKMANSSTNEFDERVCYLSIGPTSGNFWDVPSSLFKLKQLKSFLLPQHPGFEVRNLYGDGCDRFFSRNQCLRILGLHGLGLRELPKSISKLIHLRYLDLSKNDICKLPKSITKLVNLYLLDLSWCGYLQELPKDISKLVKLRHLMLEGCCGLDCMPQELGKLTNLQTFNWFVVKQQSNSPSDTNANIVCGLADLDGFENLKGELYIIFKDGSKEDEMLLEGLQRKPNLRLLGIHDYGGQRFPRWMRDQLHCWLPNLIDLRIYNCGGCKYVGSFGRLPHLKYMYLLRLENVEYIEDCSNNTDNVMCEPTSAPLFPCLEGLVLRHMPALKGWGSNEDTRQVPQEQHHLSNRVLGFPKLKHLEVDDMKLANLMATRVLRGSTSLQTLRIDVLEEENPVTPSPLHRERQPVTLLNSCLPEIHDVVFHRDKQLKVLPEEFRGATSLKILILNSCTEIESIPEWIDTLTSLTQLRIFSCPRLESLPQQMSNLSELNSLVLYDCSSVLAERCQEPTGEYWPYIKHIPSINITSKAGS